ncbi:putative leucine-rich repeat receptor-like serine/threonine-protein kinase At2g19230 [Neltuma alba]|nr:putative leucine-rich repeat receptor-like serine/threonine-protein kinase At2g19230 [Prosopis alba]
MKIASELTLLLLAFFIPLHNASWMASDSKVASSDDSDHIGIDCGVEEAYQDSESNMWYKPDSGFVETGQNHNVPYNFSKSQMSKQLNTLRSFPDGKRNCYTLTSSRNSKYIVRAFFAYGNYDLKNKKPIFDLYLGVNLWKTIEFDDITSYYSVEVILVALADTISVCLVKTGKGVPFISSLELWLLGDNIYQISSSIPLDLLTRSTPSKPGDDRFIRFKDDTYGRVWFKRSFGSSSIATTSVIIDLNGTQSTNNLPQQVLKTAILSTSLHPTMEIYSDQQTDSSNEYFCYFYFFEFDKQATNQKRIMNITFNDGRILSEPITTQYLKLLTIVGNITQANQLRISINPTPESDLPAMINAFEIYRGLKQLNSETYQEDVDAIQGIKSIYNIINWQGDPCIPASLAWEGVACTSDANPRVTSLNLSSRGLTGRIDDSFSKFIKLRSLDLSYNNLTGEVPEYFAQLPDLKVLNLTGNQLTGSIPKPLRLKSEASLSLSLEGNPGLCLAESCGTKKHATLLIACIAASIAVLIMTVLIYLMNMRIKRKKQGAFKKEGRENSKKQVFSLREVTRITSNFKTVIGKGGFGEVYLGTVQDGKEVAVKLLSQTSRQGYREFHSEVDLLTFVHHKNLVSFMGYCEEGDVKALIYEYMAKGNLQQLLSDENTTVLKWFDRLQIALDVAFGLEYLHYGIKPPIVHRDLKTSNILLDENMQAKISDFGLCRSFENEHDSHISTRPAGTLGYLDPEFRSSGNLNRKSDVYSFGIILLELITGQPAMKPESLGIKIQLLDWVNPKLNNGDIDSIVDPRLEGQYNRSSAWKLVEIAMSCAQPTAIQRPEISEVLTELKDCLASEISHERSESSMRRSRNNSLETSSLNPFQIDSSLGPHARCYINIDCGAEEAYTDSDSNIWYQTDSGFVETGKNHKLPSGYSFDQPQMSKQLNTLRSFPDGVRNCYTLTPKQGKNNKYLVRAFFAYRNYDLKHTPPSFDVYLGVNHWNTIEFGDLYMYFPIEVTHFALSDTISVCLVNIGKGVPFISSLELWLLTDSTYRTSSSFPLDILTRSTFSMSEDTLFVRFEDDVYDRVWFNRIVGNSKKISTSATIDSYGIENTNKLPSQVLKTAIQSLSLNSSLEIYFNNHTDSSHVYYINLYFFEFDQRVTTQKRIVDVTFNDKSILTDPFTTQHLKLVTIVQNITQADHLRISIKATPESDLPAMINAFEVYRVLSLTNSATYQEDADTILKIKHIYGIPIINWQGDPCIPNHFAWEELTCSSDGTPRIISLLERNPGLCLARSCKTKKNLVPLIASIAASVAVLVMIVLTFLMIRRIKKKNGVSKKDWQEKSDKYVFSLRDVNRITNNFKTKIGKGGFGEVYLGTMQDGRDVAVKLLSQTSRQGDREFHSEVNLLTIVHHKNLVSFVGYCDEGDVKALIYEYMDQGNLQGLLSGRNPNVLKWSERLQIAVDVALGLDYSHNGIRPPVVHRDLKTSNILLNKKMQGKISDFGLCRPFINENDAHISTIPAGTFGYLDPEFQRTGKLNKKSDVYSFGVILLELITGQRPIKEEASLENKSHLLHWVNRKLKNGDIKSIVDPRLQGEYNTSSAWKFIETAMGCVPPKAIQRPDISEVLSELKICLNLNQQQTHTRERSETESSRRNPNNSLDMGSLNSLGIESTAGPYAR